ncbi:MAG: hypothetical protein JWN36_3320 [Microbacteriaceae bacterium]|nr:hypothetical protein [Microbacteriaceae bacterium]
MMRRPGHAVNDGLTVIDAPLPVVDGFDLQLSIDNVVSFGGDEMLYRHFLGRALALPGADILTAASLAAWRAGVLELRADALARLDGAEPAFAAAALGLEPAELGAFVRGQERGRFFWPRQLPEIARVGGFRGLGGALQSPPVSAAPLARRGGFALHTATDDWEYDADIFGGRLSRVDVPGATGTVDDAELRVSPVSYLARLVPA